MYVMSIEYVNSLLQKYDTVSDEKIIALEILQYYQVDKKICMVLLVENCINKKYVVKLLSNKMMDIENEERQSEFSEMLRQSKIPVPKKYKTRDKKYVSGFNFEKIDFNMTVEDYFGENLNYLSTNNTVALGNLLADMHRASIKNDYHLPKGSTYRALFSGRVDINKIWDVNNKSLFEAEEYEKIKAVHQASIDKMKKMWKELPTYAVHGDLGLLSNITIQNNRYGIIDFNLSGDEVLLNDMLTTWYSSVYSFDIILKLPLEEIIANRKIFFSTYIKNRGLTDLEKQYLYDMACIVNGVYFNRFAAVLISKGFYSIVKNIVEHIISNYYRLDSDIDFCEVLQNEIRYVK